MNIAYFITPHGFGHAARAAAVMQALEKKGAHEFHIFTTVPQWFFKDSVERFFYHKVETDIGLVQFDPMNENLGATINKLNTTLPFQESQVSKIADGIKHCDVVLCDIAPLGIAAAKKAGVPSVLIENFTWDWIYTGYLKAYPQLGPHINYLGTLFNSADIHIQALPICTKGNPDLSVNPVSRDVRSSGSDTRSMLGIDERRPAVLISMGGIRADFPFLDELNKFPEVLFIIPGGGDKKKMKGNLLIVEHNSGLYHPDLINACDAAVFKAGYSTISECYHAGIPAGYLLRESFPETPALEQFLADTFQGFHILNREWVSGEWIKHVPELLNLPKLHRNVPNGADQIADFLMNLT